MNIVGDGLLCHPIRSFILRREEEEVFFKKNYDDDVQELLRMEMVSYVAFFRFGKKENEKKNTKITNETRLFYLCEMI